MEERIFSLGYNNRWRQWLDVTHINKGNAFFARESKGNAHGKQEERSNVNTA